MLQQTQVDRVIPYYRAFLKQFPNPKALADAPLSEVLIRWQGLGYNRRAKMLQEAAKASVERYGGRIPTSAVELESLPGVGPYTAGAVSAFAGNHDGIFIETNIRTVITHHFFPGKETVTDAQVTEILRKVFPKGRAREWYSALMDYGAFLKRNGVRINNKSAGYTKQASFEGSSRQVRGAFLRVLTKGPETEKVLLAHFGNERAEDCKRQLLKMTKEGLIEQCRGRYRLKQ